MKMPNCKCVKKDTVKAFRTVDVMADCLSDFVFEVVDERIDCDELREFFLHALIAGLVLKMAARNSDVNTLEDADVKMREFAAEVPEAVCWRLDDYRHIIEAMTDKSKRN